MNFKPTFLYIKQHLITGKLYFGKTVGNPENYLGSGKHWRRHIKVHGVEHVVTLWSELFTDQDECTKFALEFSEKMNIVKSDQWLNLIPENGLDGGDNFSSMTEERYKEACDKMKQSSRRSVPHLKGKTLEQINGVKRAKELKEIRSKNSSGTNNGMFGKTHSIESKKKMSQNSIGIHKGMTYDQIYGHEKSASLKKIRSLQMSDFRNSQSKLECPHCGKLSDPPNAKRWHFSNCKALKSLLFL